MTTSSTAGSPAFRLFFEAAPIPAWLFAENTLQIVAANPAAVARYGFSQDEFSRMTLDGLASPGERAGVRRQLRRLKGDGVSGVHRHVRRDGEAFEVRVRCVAATEFSAPGAGLAWVEIPGVSDPPTAVSVPGGIDSRARAFGEAPIPLVSLADDGTLLDANAAAEAMLMASQVDLAGRSFRSLLVDDHEMTATAWAGLTGALPWTGTVRLRRSDGAVVDAEARSALRSGRRVISLQDVGERMRAEGELRRSSDRYRRLSDHSRHVREEERARLSRDLHDRLGQALTGLKMDLAWLLALCDRFEPSTARSAIAVMMDRIDTTIGIVRRIAADLRPGVLDRLGLQAAIEWRAAEFERRSGVRCRLLTTGSLPELDHLQSTELFRVFEEMLTNVVRHAQATRVRITMKGERGKFALHVYDNGRGISVDAVDSEHSLGLIGMRERATLLGGTVTVSPGRRRGTLAVVRIPVKPRMVSRAAARPIDIDGSGEPMGRTAREPVRDREHD